MPSRSRWGPTAMAAVTAAVMGCGEQIVEPPPPPPDGIATVAVTSPIGGMMARGRQLQLSASAMNSSGGSVSTSFSWMSSNDAVASVSGSGLVDGLAAGPTVITATAEGVPGEFSLTVVDADLDGIASAVNDAYAARLIAGLPSGSSTTLDQLLGDCAVAVSQGHIVNLAACLASAQTAVASPSTPDETVLFAYLSLYLDHVERLLNLE